MSHRLLILACSQTKRADPGLLPAIERYDGPVFRVVRKYKRENPSCEQSLLIQILSAKYGLLNIDQPIPSYDYKMTTKHAESLQAEVSGRLKLILENTCCQDAFIYASQTYLTALGNYNSYFPPRTNTVTLISTPGYKLAELHRWLYPNQKLQSNISTPVSSEAVQIKGIKIAYTHNEVIDIIRQALNSEPAPAINFSAWYTVVDGQRIAPKWLISKLTGLPSSSFHTDTAKRVLKQLGFEVYPMTFDKKFC